MMKGGLLWLIGIPLPIILILFFLGYPELRRGAHRAVAREEAARPPFLYSAASTRGRSRPWRSRLISSAVRKATSSACSALRRGSQKVW